MQIKAIIRTPRDTPTATPILIPSLDSGDTLVVLLLLEEIGSAIERALVVEVEDVSVDDAIAIDDTTVSVTFSVVLSVVVAVVVAVVLTVSFASVPSELMLK